MYLLQREDDTMSMNERGRCFGCDADAGGKMPCADWCPIDGDEDRLAEQDPLVRVTEALWLLTLAHRQGEIDPHAMSHDASRAMGVLRSLRDELADAVQRAPWEPTEHHVRLARPEAGDNAPALEHVRSSRVGDVARRPARRHHPAVLRADVVLRGSRLLVSPGAPPVVEAEQRFAVAGLADRHLQRRVVVLAVRLPTTSRSRG